MRRKILIAALCILAVLAMFWFLDKYFAVEVEAKVFRLFPPPTVQQVESERLRRTAGWFSRDCGTVKLHEDPTSSISCASDAMRQHHSFRVAFEWVGWDSRGLIGLAGTSSGDIYEITTDELSAGGGLFNARPRQDVTVQKCEKPPREISFGFRGTRIFSCSEVENRK